MQTSVTPEMIENRARELALISGHGSNRTTSADRIQAKKELLGDDASENPTDDEGVMRSGMGAPPTSHGHKTEAQLPDDDEIETRLVEEGVKEAGHDEMLEAAKTRTRNEG